jgi:hypothetical protein
MVLRPFLNETPDPEPTRRAVAGHRTQASMSEVNTMPQSRLHSSIVGESTMATYKEQPIPKPIDGELVHLLTEQYGPIRAFVLNYEGSAPASQNPWVLWYCARDGYALLGKLPLEMLEYWTFKKTCEWHVMPPAQDQQAPMDVF